MVYFNFIFYRNFYIYFTVDHIIVVNLYSVVNKHILLNMLNNKAFLPLVVDDID